jgi:hypothetical protein
MIERLLISGPGYVASARTASSVNPLTRRLFFEAARLLPVMAGRLHGDAGVGGRTEHPEQLGVPVSSAP